LAALSVAGTPKMACATGWPRRSLDPSSMSSTSSDALCSRDTTLLMASTLSDGISSHWLNASINAPRTSLPGVSEM